MVSIINEKLTFVIKYGEVTEKKTKLTHSFPMKTFQKQLPGGVLKKSFSEKFRKITGKFLDQSLLDKVDVLMFF